MAKMMIKQGMTNKEVHAMKKRTQPGTMGNDSIHMPKKAARKWTQKEDDAYDRKNGIKEGSKEDMALDEKRGLMKRKGRHAKTKAKKAAKKLTTTARNNLPSSAFVFPATRRYPIHDESHARNALARASGKPEEAQVRAAVHRRYPDIQ